MSGLIHDDLNDAGLLAACLDAIPSAVLITDGKVVLMANARTRELLGYGAESSLVGKPVEELVHADGHDSMRQREEVLSSTSTELRGLPVKLVAADGSCVAVTATGTPVDYDGRRVFMFMAE